MISEQHLRQALRIIYGMSGKSGKSTAIQYPIIKKLWSIPGFIDTFNIALVLAWTNEHIDPLEEIVRGFDITDEDEREMIISNTGFQSTNYANILLQIGIADKSKQMELAKGHPDAFLLGLAKEVKEYGLRRSLLDSKALRHAIRNSKLSRSYPIVKRIVARTLQQLD